jgi:hypothetical protein
MSERKNELRVVALVDPDGNNTIYGVMFHDGTGHRHTRFHATTDEALSTIVAGLNLIGDAAVVMVRECP